MMLPFVEEEDEGLEGRVTLLLARVRTQGGVAYAKAMGAGEHQVAYDMAWEQLHLGSWHDVHPAWRDAFSLSCFLLASLHRRNGNHALALSLLDSGLLMGGPLLRPHLHSAISCMSAMDIHNQGEPSARECPESENEDSKKDPTMSEESNVCIRTQEATMNNTQSKLMDISCLNKVSVELPPGSLDFMSVKKAPFLAIEDFLCEFFIPRVPVIITDAIVHWPAMKKWEDMDYLCKVLGNRTVPVEVGEHYLASEWKQELMTASKVLESLYTFDSPPCARPYLAQHPLFDQIPQLMEDIAIPDYCTVSGGDLNSINAWLGPCGTVTPLHHDPHHNLLAQVVGQKYVRLYSSDISENLYPFSENMLSNSSQVDVDNPDYDKYPLSKDLAFVDCILNKGEMLYIPPKWWHYVRSLSPSFSVSFWWNVSNDNSELDKFSSDL